MNVNELNRDPMAMEPLIPEDASGELEGLATELMTKTARLSGSLHPITLNALAAYFGSVNSYYTHLIAGHDTTPSDIESALKSDFSDDPKKSDLQKEALAHIRLHKELVAEMVDRHSDLVPTSEKYLRSIHKRFYEALPLAFQTAKRLDGTIKELLPGQLRMDEVKVGKHHAPYSTQLPLFMHRFETNYDPKSPGNKSKIRRVISIAASHHRLAWIHPFLGGNGRVLGLFTDAYLAFEGLHASGLWSISRGLARHQTEYKNHLAAADLKRLNAYDGTGNLSNRKLEEFCVYFLTTAIDQVDFMLKTLHTITMQERMEAFVADMVFKKRLKPEAIYVLTDVFLKGKITKKDAMRITNTSDKTLKALIDTLVEMDLIKTVKEGLHMVYYAHYPIACSPWLFPGVYPKEVETELMNQTA